MLQVCRKNVQRSLLEEQGAFLVMKKRKKSCLSVCVCEREREREVSFIGYLVFRILTIWRNWSFAFVSKLFYLCVIGL